MLKHILPILFLVATIINAQFTPISTTIIDGYYKNVFTSFLQPATSGINLDFPSIGNTINAQENLVNARVSGNALVEGRATVNPMTNGDVVTSNVKFYALFRDANPENCQVQISITMLYALRNDGASAADLNYALNQNILFAKNGNFASSSGDYRIQLRQSNSSGSNGTLIYDSGTMTASLVNQQRGTVFSNVSPNETKYVLLDVWVYAASEFASGSLFLVDGSQGIGVGFDNEAIAANHGLNNEPGIDTDAKMKFQLHNLYANDASGPAMGVTGANAFNNLDWLNNITEAYAIEENTDLLDGVDNITVTMDDFRLFSFDLRGTAGVDQRDRRVYINGTAKIYQNDVLKLELNNCRIGLNVNYPAGAGDGSETTGGGWGQINAANSDDTWESEFDPHNTGNIEFVFNSFSTVVNNPFFDAVISLEPRDNIEKIIGWAIPTGGGNYNYLNDYFVGLDFNSASQNIKSYSVNADAGNVMIRMVADDPGGSLPTGINVISPERFWELGTTLSSFNVDATFDLSGIGGVSNMSNIRILHRNDENSAWTILDPNTNTYTINGTQITVDGITSFSQFGIGSTGDNALPVELTTFSAVPINGNVELNWKTETELNNYGFKIERLIHDKNDWTNIGFVEGAGNSNSQKTYKFIDTNLPENSHTYFAKYRLKQIDVDGTFEYSPVVEVEVSNIAPTKLILNQNYPNPFNPVTTIKFEIPGDNQNNKTLPVTLKVYNLVGELVSTLINESKPTGKYSVDFNASGLASGIYFYELKTPGQRLIQKMNLVK